MMADVVKSIQDVALEQIKGLGPRVESYVVDKIVDRELEKRAVPITQGMDTLTKFEEELKKVDKPDMIARDKEGKVVSEAYSSKRLEEIKKAKEKIEKLHKAIEKAYIHGDVKDLNQLNQSSGKDKAESGAGNTEEAS
jgi:histidinol dehydrogenase